jgi:hypothetical protein
MVYLSSMLGQLLQVRVELGDRVRNLLVKIIRNPLRIKGSFTYENVGDFLYVAEDLMDVSLIRGALIDKDVALSVGLVNLDIRLASDVVGEDSIILLEDVQNLFVLGADLLWGEDVDGFEDLLVLVVMLELVGDLVVFL